jgi:hypothetical protein
MFGKVYKPSTLAAGLGIDTGVCDLPSLIRLTSTVRVAGIILIFLFLFLILILILSLWPNLLIS